MLHYALVFLVTEPLAGQFGGPVGTFTDLTHTLFLLFPAIMVISLIVGFIQRA